MSAMKTENIEDIYELTPVQKGMLFHSLYERESSLYFFHTPFGLRGNLNVKAFEEAWQRIVDRHPSLRTGFYWEDIDNPLQVVYKNVKISLNQYDWRGIEQAEQEERLKSFYDSDRKLYFDLSQPYLMRLTLIRLVENYHEFIMSTHHIAADGWSGSIIFDEFLQIYEALCEGKEIRFVYNRPFRDYIDWLQEQDIAKTESFWRQQLAGIKAPTPLIYLENKQLTFTEERYDQEKYKLSKERTKELLSFIAKNHLTLAALINGIWSILISRYTCRSNIVYGCTVTGRPVDLAEVELMVGIFINTLPINLKLNTEQDLLSWLQSIQTKLAELRQYEYTSLTQIQSWSEVPQNLPLFESFVVVENLPSAQSSLGWKVNIEIDTSKGEYFRTNYPLNLVIYPESEMIMAISYDCRRFDIATISGILADFQIVLECIMANPLIKIKDLSFSTARQQQISKSLEKEAILFD
ncbi:non-ribosomal peptide synthetase [Mastigocladus laminosus UU774]|nr:non-ribosomal peptide synthetase [Mastigocladus laminosus UU774]